MMVDKAKQALGLDLTLGIALMLFGLAVELTAPPAGNAGAGTSTHVTPSDVSGPSARPATEAAISDAYAYP